MSLTADLANRTAGRIIEGLDLAEVQDVELTSAIDGSRVGDAPRPLPETGRASSTWA